MEEVATRNIMQWLRRVKNENKILLIKNWSKPTAFLLPYSNSLMKKIENEFDEREKIAIDMKKYYKNNEIDEDWEKIDLDFKI